MSTELKTRKKKNFLSEQQINALQEAYELGTWMSHERTPKGHSNQSFFLNTSSGEYVIRRSSPKRKILKSLEFEVQLIDYLHSKGYSGPELMHTRLKNGYLEHEGLLYIITRRIHGGPYERENTQHLCESARALGRYHSLVRDYPFERYSRDASVFDSLRPEGLGGVETLKRCAAEHVGSDQQELLEEILDYLQARLEGVTSQFSDSLPHLEQTVIQGSMGKSALIYQGDQIAGVVDFDRAALEYRALDFAYSLKSFCGFHGKGDEAYNPHLDLQRVELWMDAYRETETIDSSEAKAITTVFQAQRLAKAQKKATNTMKKLARKEDKRKVISDLIEILERTCQWVRWVEDNESAIHDAILH
ncbi:phosphotransferase [Myxococcota bacterium]|nr:phosphotransferase [Myxococcota bacterium]